MTLLALVVMLQSGIILWTILFPGGRDRVLADLRRTPVVGQVVEVCLPAARTDEGISPAPM